MTTALAIMLCVLACLIVFDGVVLVRAIDAYLDGMRGAGWFSLVLFVGIILAGTLGIVALSMAYS